MTPDLEITAEAFARWCVPQAVAALAGCRPIDVARPILARQRWRGVIAAPGASMLDAAALLAQRGFVCTLFLPPDHQPWADHADLLELDRRRWPDRRPTVAPRPHPTPVEQVAQQTGLDSHAAVQATAERWQRVQHGAPALRDWLAKRWPGSWLVSVAPPEPGTSHALAVRDGDCLTGRWPDDEFDAHRVVEMLRVERGDNPEVEK